MTRSLQSVALIGLLAVSACGGRAANPIMAQQYGDERKGCPAIESELISIQQEISRLVPDTQGPELRLTGIHKDART